MNKLIYALPLYLGLLLWGTIVNTSVQGQDTTPRFSKEQLVSDLDALFETLETIHPDLYAYTSKNSINQLLGEAKSQITDDMTALEFWKIAGPVVARLGDGHTGLHFPRSKYHQFTDSSNIVFPLDVAVRDNKLFVVKNYSPDSLPGVNYEVISVNGMDAQTLLNEIRRYQWGERQSFIDLKTGLYFNIYLWMLYGPAADFSIEFRSSVDGVARHKKIEGIPYHQYNLAKQSNRSNDKDFWFYSYPDEKIGVIEFNAMIRGNDFKLFLDSTFRTIKAQGITDLVIDIRKNGGGNSSLVNTLFSYFNTTAYTQATQIDLKVSKQARKQFRKMIFKWYTYPLYPVTLFHRETRPILWGQKGRVVSLQYKPEKRKTREPFFTGGVYVLTSPNTFSSANILAAVFKCYEMGTIIGEETGGLTIAFGDLIYFSLPNTKLPGICSYKKFYHPCGSPDNHGVIPDIEVKPNPDDLKENRDSVLEFTIRHILEKR